MEKWGPLYTDGGSINWYNHFGKQYRDPSKIENRTMMLLLLFGHPVLSNSLQPHGLQHSSLPGPRHLLKFAQVHVHFISDAISDALFSFCLNISQHQRLSQ